MRRTWLTGLVMCIAIAIAMPMIASAQDELVLLDFDTGDKPNNIGGDFGAWDRDPNDETQWCEISFEYGDDALGEEDGYSLRLSYDVDSPNPAYNGFWTKLEGEDFSDYNTLNLYVKGDPDKGFTKRLKIEVKDYQKSAAYILSGISDEWQKYSIPFEKFKAISDWSSMNEFVIVFDDINSNPKEGSILLDNVTVSNE
ncbi:MAG: CIA30 family protein [Candidatus Omnitrophica bacterium]|nr:CIA30 family protein [Candidatus Omnitrophota bacterium]